MAVKKTVPSSRRRKPLTQMGGCRVGMWGGRGMARKESRRGGIFDLNCAGEG